MKYAYGHPLPLFISRRHAYFPSDCINWIEEELSIDSTDFIIRWDLLKPVSIN